MIFVHHITATETPQASIIHVDIMNVIHGMYGSVNYTTIIWLRW